MLDNLFLDEELFLELNFSRLILEFDLVLMIRNIYLRYINKL